MLPAEIAKSVKALTDEAQLHTRDPRTPPNTNAAAPSSTQTQLSVAARTLADVLLKYPELPPALKAAAPLLSAATQEPAQVAKALQRGIGESGLFYESHVARWFTGKLPLNTLAREPQMRGWQPTATPAVLKPVVVAGASTAILATQSDTTERPAPTLPHSRVVLAESEPASIELERAREQAPLSQEARHTLVRHQLELLVNPLIRWEGEIWPGLWVALQIAAPQEEERQTLSEQGQDSRGSDESDSAWSLQIDTALPSHGDVTLKMRIASQSIVLTLISTSESLYGYFAATQHQLREQLQQHGLAEVELQFQKTESVQQDGGAVQ